ncbi:MAG: dienelactone hydrolase family protein [Mycobacteriales bacterium]
MADDLSDWTRGSFTHGGVTHETFRKGSGPGVVVIHEIPNIYPKVIRFGNEVVEAGFTVVMPSLFGVPAAPLTRTAPLRALARGCVNREFTVWATGRTSPIAGWLRALAKELHEEIGGSGVGAIGMCFTGGFALAMTVEPHTVAPVLSQPSLPLAIPFTDKGADLGLSPADLAAVKAGDCPVMGLRYTDDPAVGTRFDTLRRELGDRFVAVEFPGRKHSVLTEHRQQEGVDRVLAFLHERLDPAAT